MFVFEHFGNTYVNNRARIRAICRKNQAVFRFELRMAESESGVLTATLHSRLAGTRENSGANAYLKIQAFHAVRFASIGGDRATGADCTSHLELF